MYGLSRYHLVFQALGLGNISVGAPYFDSMFVPMSFILFLFMGLGVVVRWHKVGPLGVRSVKASMGS
ncbi:cytochrome c-type biogenesis CcmF C-terminal domain-containing protein [Photobacterium satsumensis]|uniref:cytochrome c-type biogenesis CcmF C-terminal domain-containing protein n=1 Tax=Photobacterium satsumensis TaxID=2910239 RepID=UPI003D0D052A